MAMSATTLRGHLYQVLDEVLRTGEPVEIERKGKRLLIVPEEAARAMAPLVPRPDYLRSDPDALVHVDWEDTWRP